MPVGNAHDSVFAPTIGARSGMIMRKEIPSRAVRAVVFADSAPLPLGQIWSPALPMDFALACFFQTMFFRSTDLERIRASSKYDEAESLTFLSVRASSVGSL